MKIPECATNDACPMGYQCFVAEKCLGATQQNANALGSQNNINAQQQSLNQWRFSQVEMAAWRYMTASDLGIVDQLLDDKVGMEP